MKNLYVADHTTDGKLVISTNRWKIAQKYMGNSSSIRNSRTRFARVVYPSIGIEFQSLLCDSKG